MANPRGIQLRSLRLRGQGRAEARIDFSPGLNVISGVSDTGKSYILKCIDFLFGASKKPKDIDEANGYEQVYLECLVLQRLFARKGLDNSAIWAAGPKRTL